MSRRGPRAKARLIDFCCKAGGISMGYHMAGFEVVGVDKEPQPNYPFRFHQQDILTITDRQAISIRRNFDAVAGSPPCQIWSKSRGLARMNHARDHPDLISDTRELFEYIGLPYVIENVVGAPLRNPIQVCGSYLGLRLRRHRWFESNVSLEGTPCTHEWQNRDKRYFQQQKGPGSERYTGVCTVFGRGEGNFFNGQSHVEIWSHAMGIDWMVMNELSQAIPPLYGLHIGRQLIRHV